MYIDERTAADVLAPLRDESSAPPRVDLRLVKSEARRRLRRRRVTTATGAFACMAAIAIAVPLGVAAVRHPTPVSHHPTPAATAPPTVSPTSAVPKSLTCTESVLPVPGGVASAVITGGDPTGRYLVGQSYPQPTGDHYQPLIWDNGLAHKVPLPGLDAIMVAVSSNGTAVGQSFTGNVQSAFIYRDGRVTKLGGATSAGASAVNNAGMVVGGRIDHNVSVPVVWRTPTSPATDLPLPGPSWRGSASEILNDGSIVGAVSPSSTSSESQVIMWSPNGSFRLLPLPRVAGVTGITGFQPLNVSQNILIGNAIESTTNLMRFYGGAYELATGAYIDLSQAKMSVWGGNAQHWLVGAVLGQDPSPSLWTPGTGLIRLPTLAATSEMTDQAIFVSDDGRVIAGSNTDKHRVERAVMWRCH
jgi:hypothetical protein